MTMKLKFQDLITGWVWSPLAALVGAMNRL